MTDSKFQVRAQAKVAAKPAGQVKPGAGGDINKTPEGGAIGTDTAALAGEQRVETTARRPAKDGSVKRKSSQGGTPK